jgi:opacity protein-like surface antigen
MISKIKFIAILLILIVSASPIKPELYIEGYGGGMMGLSDIAHLKTKNTYGINGLKASFDVPTKRTASTFLGGLKLGLWFDKTGCLKFGGPDWLKHLGFYLDLGFNPLDYNHKIKSKIHYTQDNDSHSAHAKIHLSSEGSSETLAFMFALRANCFKTKKIPYGRLQPYIGIGPSVLFTSQRTKLTVLPHSTDYNNFSIILLNPYKIKPKHKNSKADISLSVDAGLRQMLLHNLSLDYSFKYRFAPISFKYHNDDKPISIKHRYNLFSFQLGLGYHF